MSSQEIQAIEQNIQAAKTRLEFGAALERLQSNRDFRRVIEEGYFRDEAVRLVHLKADPNMQTEESQRSIVQQMDAIGSLSQYFVTVRQLAGMAARSIEGDEAMLEEIRAEEVRNG